MKRFLICIPICFLLGCIPVSAQKKPPAKGKLFIIGGGTRSEALMKSLVATAAFKTNDYVVVLPMSSEEPDTAFYYFKADLEMVCANPIVNFNFTKQDIYKKSWLDSLEHAKLIFISGGDQVRFMKVVLHTPVYNAIHKAFANGATVSGTSAGAAVMSRYMITGSELSDTTYYSTFRKLEFNNIEIKEGLSLITSAVIDQHFIARSRYNRLLSALAKYPSVSCIGIDEATAIIVQGNKVKVVGDRQVILMKKPEQLKITPKGLIKWKDIQFSIFTAGDEFVLF